MMPHRHDHPDPGPSRAARRLMCLRPAGGMAVLVLLTLLALLGDLPHAGFKRVSIDSLQAGRLDVARLVAGAMSAPGARTPLVAPRAPLSPEGPPPWLCAPRVLPAAPAGGKRNLPSDGEYAFTRTRVRTLSPLCRIACG